MMVDPAIMSKIGKARFAVMTPMERFRAAHDLRQNKLKTTISNNNKY